MSHKRYEVVNQINAFFKSGNEDVDALVRNLETVFPGITIAEVLDAMHVSIQEDREREAELRARANQSEHIYNICKRCAPKAATVREAIEIGAAAGDPEAIAVLNHWNSKAYRCGSALLDAAMHTSPLWQYKGNHRWRYLGKGEPPSSSQIVDLFEKNHPQEAKRIVAEIEAAT